MTPKTIHLNKLLKLFQLSEKELTSALRCELRAERDKLRGTKQGGGDFHSPFWFDAKLHLIANADLRAATKQRITDSKQRERLYPALCAGFLAWLDNLRRNTNQKVGWREGSVHNHFLFEDLQLIVKVDNLLSLHIGLDSYRLVYPYFSEHPLMTERWARVALWVMSQALSQHGVETMEVLDVLRGRAFRGDRIFFKGDEEALFSSRYTRILDEWDELRSEYEL